MTTKYDALPAGEKFEEFHDRSSSSDSLDRQTLVNEDGSRVARHSHKYTGRWMWLVHAVLLCLSSAMFAAAYNTRLSTLRHVKQFSAYSPAASSVEYEQVKFNLSMNNGSPFVGYGPEVDEAWLRISYDMGDQMITPEELKILQMPESSLKVKHPKTGVEGYRVGLEVFHHLHCLNLLRQVTYKDWYSDISGNFAAGPEALQMHTDHCLEVLRQNIQCNADIGLFTFYMLDGDPLPWPELNSLHTCRKFDKVKDWAMDHSVGNMEEGVELTA